MDFYEKEKAIMLRRQIIREQEGKCFVCGKEFTYKNHAEIAHRIPKHKWILKKYGPEVVHHRENLRATCKNCNSAVLINPDSLPGQKLIMVIRAEIEGSNGRLYV